MKRFLYNQQDLLAPLKDREQAGNALLIVMVLFVAISLSIGLGLVVPVLRANRIATNNLESKRSYVVAESGVEDILYRLLKSKQVSSTESIVLGTQTTTTTVTDVSGGGKQIQSIGTTNTRSRTVTAIVEQGVGVSFNYGVQTGRGGITMGNGASIIGNVYANGNITGGAITGTAVAANSAALSADQTNDTPSTPSSSITFRNTASTADLAQGFQVSTNSPINKIQLYIKKVGSPANMTVRIVSDASGTPGTNNLLSTQGTLSAASVGTSYGWVDVVFSDNPTLYPSTTYWLILDNGATSSSNYYVIGANDNGYGNGAVKIGAYAGTWNNPSPTTLDSYFKVYLGGLTSTISSVTVGTSGTGDAWAHTISGGSVAGTKYCQVGTGCNTSRADPSPIGFPISDSNIETWKDEALTGGIISGNYSVSGSQSLGPKKITGNLTVTNGAILTVTGTLWVVGNITVSNNGLIKLVSTYVSDDGVIVSDGRILISNNGVFAGSGTSGSYIMALTTSDCPTSSSCGGANAIDVSNNAGAVILNAQHGTININNNANLIEATGEELSLSNNATVTYQSGLADMTFTSGPSGSWNIESWHETQ